MGQVYFRRSHTPPIDRAKVALEQAGFALKISHVCK